MARTASRERPRRVIVFGRWGAVVALAALGACGGSTPHPRRPPTARPEASDESAGDQGSGEASPSAKIRAPLFGGEVDLPNVRPEQNGRLDASLPPGPWTRKWAARLGDGLAPRSVLAVGARILVVGEHAYALFDTNGAPLGEGELKITPRLIPESGVFVAGTKDAPALVSLERGELATLSTADAGLRDEELHVLDGTYPFAASHRGRVVYARSGAIRAIEDGRDAPLIEGAFDVLGLSLDGAGGAAVLVRQKKATSLWLVPPHGGSIGAVRLGTVPRGPLTQPPLLGDELRVLVFATRLLALRSDGRVRYSRAAPAVGATLTSDDHLLLVEDHDVVAVAPTGRAEKLTSADEPLVTPPILGTSGLLVVCSATNLLAFESRPAVPPADASDPDSNLFTP